MNAFQKKETVNPNLFIVAARWAEFLTKFKKTEVDNG
jgi:hypothetical protein